LLPERHDSGHVVPTAGFAFATIQCPSVVIFDRFHQKIKFGVAFDTEYRTIRVAPRYENCDGCDALPTVEAGKSVFNTEIEEKKN